MTHRIHINRAIIILAIGIFALTIGAAPLLAQGKDTGNPLPQSPATRAEALAKEFGLKSKKSSAFVELYVKYENELHQNPEGQMPPQAPTAPPEGNPSQGKKMTDGQAEEMILGMFSRERRRIDVQEKYYPLFKEMLSPTQILQIYSSREGGAGFPEGPGGRREPGKRPSPPRQTP